MGRNPEQANFDGMPLTGLHNIDTSFFSEADDTQYPDQQDPPKEPQHDYVPVELQHSEVEQPFLSFGNKSLPIYEHLPAIIETLTNHQVTIIRSPTGTGKSTQVPQAAYASGCFDTIDITQPRRPAAYGIRERIRYEMNDVMHPGAGDRLTCYQTAIAREGPEDAPIRVVTDGLKLMREFHARHTPGQRRLIIIDEFHERNFNVDLLAALVKRAITEEPDLRVLIMSATMDSQRQANYFADACGQPPVIIEVEGKNFDVQRIERPESTVTMETLRAAKEIYANGDPQNTILAFQAGKTEIKDTIDEVRRLLPPEIRKVATVLPFHSKLSPEEQQRVFVEYPGVVIIVSTNSAQTSLTLPRVKYVIDSGQERREELDQRGATGLALNNISKADCDQRAGRAGRVCAGIYIGTRANQESKYILYADRPEYPVPEILRTDIVRNTLRCAGAGFDIATIGLMDAPTDESISRAKATLRAYETTDADDQITALGMRVDQFPLRVSSSVMMVEAGRFSEHTRALMAAIVASREVGGLQLFGRDVARRWEGPDGLTEEKDSDLLAQLDIFVAVQDMSDRELRNYDLDVHNVIRAREQYWKVAKLVNARVKSLLPASATERADIIGCVVAGLTHSMYMHEGDGFFMRTGQEDVARQLSNRSVVKGHPAAVVGDPYRVEYISNGNKVVRHTVEYPMALSTADLTKYAGHLAAWRHSGYILRAGQFVEVQRQHIGWKDLGVSRETTAQPSPQLRQAVIEHAQAHPGSAQRELHDIKRTLERYAHLAKDHVPQLTQDFLISLLHQAAPADIADPSELDHNVRRLVLEKQITLATFLSLEQEQHIIENAPSVIQTVEGVVLPLTYRKGVPIVTHTRTADLAQIEEQPYLPDGRQVRFRLQRNVVAFYEIQNALGVGYYAVRDVIA